jgi:hypothetical protein
MPAIAKNDFYPKKAILLIAVSCRAGSSGAGFDPVAFL